MTDRKDRKDLQLPDKHENNPNENQHDDGNVRMSSKRSFLFMVGILLFAGLAGGIFIFANRKAEMSGLGFPAFEDTSFTLRDQKPVPLPMPISRDARLPCSLAIAIAQMFVP